MSVCSAYPNIVTRPAAVPSASTADLAGQHRRAGSAAARAGRAFDLVARLGSVVSLGALLVLACTAAGIVNDMAPAEIPTVTVTFDHEGR